MIKFNKNKIRNRYGRSLNIPDIKTVSSIINPKSNSLIFCNSYSKKYEKKLKLISNSFILTDADLSISSEIFNNNIFAIVKNPRMEFCYILKNFIVRKDVSYSSELSFNRSSNVHSSCVIEPYVYIEENVRIGKNCYIKSGAKILSNVVIGDNCVIGYNSVIGDIGFGIERINKDKPKKIPMQGIPMKIPHYGGVKIGDEVEIGSLNTIVSGTIEPTIICDHVKTDDQVHIGHNCKIGNGVLIAASAEINGSVEIGDNSWVGPNSSIFQKLTIGKRCTIGIGASVFEDIKDDEVYMSIPARKIR